MSRYQFATLIAEIFELDSSLILQLDTEELSRNIPTYIAKRPRHSGLKTFKIEEEIGKEIDILVMVQGDEPMDTPTMISDALRPIREDETVDVVNLMGRIESVEEFEDPNEVKVVINKNSDAIYFSREGIPTRKKGVLNVPMLKQVCVIPFRREYLLKFNKMSETELERIESVDMMRIIENGESVKMVMTESEIFSVDTEQDRARVEGKMESDLLMGQYKQTLD